jgi:hypothetical protein
VAIELHMVPLEISVVERSRLQRPLSRNRAKTGK